MRYAMGSAVMQGGLGSQEGKSGGWRQQPNNLSTQRVEEWAVGRPRAGEAVGCTGAVIMKCNVQCCHAERPCGAEDGAVQAREGRERAEEDGGRQKRTREAGRGWKRQARGGWERPEEDSGGQRRTGEGRRGLGGPGEAGRGRPGFA